jgi:hypothetical protein
LKNVLLIKYPLFILSTGSNLFRFLKKAVKVQVPVVLEEMQKMVPASAPKPGPRCLLSIANRYPLVFELFFNQSRENNCEE